MATRRDANGSNDAGASKPAASKPAGDVAAPVQRAIGPGSQARLEAAILGRLPGTDPAPLELFLYASGTAKMLDAMLDRIVRPHGIDGTQFTMLFVLWCADPPHVRSPTELHRLLVLSPGGVSHTIRRLEAGGLVTRRADRSDGRAKAVQLSRRGVTLVRKCATALQRELGRALDTLDAESADLVRTQRELTAAISRAPTSYPATARRGDGA